MGGKKIIVLNIASFVGLILFKLHTPWLAGGENFGHSQNKHFAQSNVNASRLILLYE